jgi:hypothetical protein
LLSKLFGPSACGGLYFYDICSTKNYVWEEVIKKLKKEKRSKVLLVSPDQPVKRKSQVTFL